MRRAFFLAYGFSVYLFFLATFLYMIGFIGDVPGLRTIDSGTAGDPWLALVVDVLLLSVFAVQHSVMARSGFKRWWTRIVPQPIERSTFVLAASLALVLVVWQWRPLARARVVGRRRRRANHPVRAVRVGLGGPARCDLPDQPFRAVRAAAGV